MTEISYFEKDLAFSFPENVEWIVLDKRDAPRPSGMAFVDIVIKQNHRVLLVEIKDPSHSQAPDHARTEYMWRIQSNALICDELTPKARDSYTYLHLMALDSKPFVYVVLLGLDAFDNEKALLIGFKDRLLQRIRHEAETPWKRNYIEDCTVLTVDTWNASFPEWHVQRIPTTV